MSAVEFHAVSKSFRHRAALFGWLGRERSGETRALNEVSFTARAGEIMAILGPNGSGKTTLLKLISTTLLPDAGRVEVGGANTLEDDQRVRQQVGFAVASERSFFPRLTARENLDYFAALENLSTAAAGQQIERALADTDLLPVADIWVAKFSSGMLQRLGMARALLKSPKVLLLDEPTRSLDLTATEEAHRKTRELAAGGATVLLATHSFEEAAALADRILILRQGEVALHHAVAHISVEKLRALYTDAQGLALSAAAQEVR